MATKFAKVISMLGVGLFFGLLSAQASEPMDNEPTEEQVATQKARIETYRRFESKVRRATVEHFKGILTSAPTLEINGAGPMIPDEAYADVLEGFFNCFDSTASNLATAIVQNGTRPVSKIVLIPLSSKEEARWARHHYGMAVFVDETNLVTESLIGLKSGTRRLILPVVIGADYTVMCSFS